MPSYNVYPEVEQAGDVWVGRWPDLGLGDVSGPDRETVLVALSDQLSSEDAAPLLRAQIGQLRDAS